MRLLLYPHFPTASNKITDLCQDLGIDMVNDISKGFDIVMSWNNETTYTHGAIMQGLHENHNVINYRCNDVSKIKVDEVFSEIFGYSITVNPATWRGRAVVKSIAQYKHDGVIIRCPTSKEYPECVVQKVIDTRIKPNVIEDIRVPVFGSHIPCVVLKRMPAAGMFSSEKVNAAVVWDTSAIFTQEEQSKILRFASQMGCDYGELDVLRDSDGLLYIIDVNNMAGNGAFKCMPVEDATRLRRLFAHTFKKVFIDAKKEAGHTDVHLA